MNLESWITVTILVALIASLIQIGAYAAPMWIWLKSSGSYIGFGLWYSVGCTNGVCTVGTQTVAPNMVFEGVPLLVMRVLQSVAVAGIVALVVFLIVLRIGVSSDWHGMKTLNLAAFVLAIVTVIILLASAGVFGGYYWNTFTFVNNGFYDGSSIPWSPLLSLLAAIILVVVSIFIITCARPRRYVASSIPMSGDTKMELNPHVQNGMVNRYYNPTPYHDDRIRIVDDYRAPRYDGRYDNRSYVPDREPIVVYAKPTAQSFRDNRDRELGHTIYTGNGFSYLEGDAVRNGYGRPASIAELAPVRGHYDDYYDRNLGGGRVVSPASTTNIYRPHQY